MDRVSDEQIAGIWQWAKINVVCRAEEPDVARYYATVVDICEELQQRRAQVCRTCASWEHNYNPRGTVCYTMRGPRSKDSYCSEWRQLGGDE